MKAVTNSYSKGGINMRLVKDIMITNIFTLEKEASVLEAMKKISEHRINGMPIIDHTQKLVGYLSDGDIMRYLGFDERIPTWSRTLAFEYGINVADHEEDIEHNFEHNVERVSQKKAIEIATKRITTVKEDDTLIHAARILAKEKLKKLPVIKEGKLVGIVSEGDVIRLAYDLYLKNNR